MLGCSEYYKHVDFSFCFIFNEITAFSLQQNRFSLRSQAFTSPPDMASSSVRENVFLTKTPTFDGVCGMEKAILPLPLIPIPHMPSNVGVMVRKTFSHTLDEAMSGGLVKACDLRAVNIVSSNRAHLPLCPRLQIKISYQVMI